MVKKDQVAHSPAVKGMPVPTIRPETTAPSHINLCFLEAHAFGNKGFIVKMIDLFREQAPGLLSKLEGGLADGDREQVRFVAHTLKSSARMLGITALTQALEQVERQAVRPGDPEALQSWALRATLLCEAALEELEAARQRYL